MMRAPSILALVSVLTVATIAPVRADLPPTTIDLSLSSGSLQPGSSYGPWQFATLSARTTAGKDKPGISVTTRRDGDAAAPSSGTTVSVDDYHQFSTKAFGYAAIQAASGSIFPTRGGYAEFDGTLREGLAFGAGAGISVDANGLVQRYASVGPTLYFAHGNATVRYLPVWTQGQVGASSWIADLSLGDEGRSVVSFHLQDGVAPAFAADDPTLSSRFANRSFVAGIGLRSWVTPRFGFTAGVEVGDERDRATGVEAYSRTSISLGMFVGVGRAKP